MNNLAMKGFLKHEDELLKVFAEMSWEKLLSMDVTEIWALAIGVCFKQDDDHWPSHISVPDPVTVHVIDLPEHRTRGGYHNVWRMHVAFPDKAVPRWDDYWYMMFQYFYPDDGTHNPFDLGTYTDERVGYLGNYYAEKAVLLVYQMFEQTMRVGQGKDE